MENQFINSKKGLARALQTSPTTIRRYVAKAGFPPRTAKGWDVEAVAKFIANNHTRSELARGEAKALREEKLREEIRKLRIESDAKERALVSIAKLKAATDATVSGAEEILERHLGAWAEAVAGLDVMRARQCGRDVKDSLMADLRGLAGHWNF